MDSQLLLFILVNIKSDDKKLREIYFNVVLHFS
jgi:hypothetical protein